MSRGAEKDLSSTTQRMSLVVPGFLSIFSTRLTTTSPLQTYHDASMVTTVSVAQASGLPGFARTWKPPTSATTATTRRHIVSTYLEGNQVICRRCSCV